MGRPGNNHVTVGGKPASGSNPLPTQSISTPSDNTEFQSADQETRDLLEELIVQMKINNMYQAMTHNTHIRPQDVE